MKRCVYYHKLCEIFKQKLFGYCIRELTMNFDESETTKIPTLEGRMLGFEISIVRSTVDFRRQVIFETVYYIICAIASTIRIVISVLNSSAVVI